MIKEPSLKGGSTTTKVLLQDKVIEPQAEKTQNRL